MFFIFLSKIAIASTLEMPANIFIEEPPEETQLTNAAALVTLAKSVGAWRVADSTVDFDRVDEPDDADVTVGWAPTSDFPEGSWGVTYTQRRNDQDDVILDAHIALRADVDWKTETSLDFESTLTHEIGHALGFGHSNFSDDTMYHNAAAGETNKRSLTVRERDMVKDVYPAIYCGDQAGALSLIFLGLGRRRKAKVNQTTDAKSIIRL